MKEKGLGVFTCTAVIVGSMIGSAIFSLSGLTMFKAGPAASLSWIIAAAIMFFYGQICSELAIRYPQSGGIFVFPAKAFNSPLLGWMSNWGSLLANIVAIAFASIYFGIYLGAGFGIDSAYQVPIALLSIGICIILNLIDFNRLGKLNTVLVFALIASMVFYIVTALSSGTYNPENLKPFFTQGVDGKFAFLSCVPTAMLGYGNIVSMTYLVSQVKNPKRTIPKSVLFALITVAMLYTLMIAATLGNIRISYLIENPSMAYIPMYATCFTTLSGYPVLAKVITIAAVLALFTTNLILISITGASLRAASQSNILPKCFQKNLWSILISSLIAGILSCFPSFVEIIVNYGALFAAVTVIINILSLIRARKNDSEQKPSIFKAPGGKFVPVIMIFIIFVCYIPDILSGWPIWLYTSVSYLIGFLIYRIRKVEL